MGRAKGTAHYQALFRAQQPRDGVDAGGLQGLLEGDGGQDGAYSAGKLRGRVLGDDAKTFEVSHDWR